jgi:hypothetical protein
MGKHQRKSTDRRNEDVGPPAGWKDRRISVERRLPEIIETDMSEADFFKELMAVKMALRQTLTSTAHMPFQAAPAS